MVNYWDSWEFIEVGGIYHGNYCTYYLREVLKEGLSYINHLFSQGKWHILMQSKMQYAYFVLLLGTSPKEDIVEARHWMSLCLTPQLIATQRWRRGQLGRLFPRKWWGKGSDVTVLLQSGICRWALVRKQDRHRPGAHRLCEAVAELHVPTRGCGVCRIHGGCPATIVPLPFFLEWPCLRKASFISR